jgi:kynurenine formamidase
MCAPAVIAAVREEWSRRRFLGTLSAAAVAPVVAPVAPDAQSAPVRLPRGFQHIFDLTHTLSPKMPVVPSFQPMRYVPLFSISKDGFQCGEITLNEHTGTHMDAPVHFVDGAMTVDRIPVDRFFAPLVVISIADRVQKDPDTAVTPEDIQIWERRHGKVPPGAFVAMHSGWDAKIGDSASFLNRDAKGTSHTPGFSGEAAAFLTKERDIVGVGVDTLSLDLGTSTGAPAHLGFLGAGKYGIEVIANLAGVPASGATVIVGGPKHLAGTGGPVRLFAVA